MRYFGGKTNIGKQLLEVVLKDARPGQVYVEPFVGGCSVIQHVKDRRRIGCDMNPYIICLFKAVQNGWIPPEGVEEDEYDELVKERKKKGYNRHLDVTPRKAFISLVCSFSGIQWSGWSWQIRDFQMYDISLSGKRSVLKTKPLIQDVEFRFCDYRELKLPAQSIIYADPPYVNVAEYPETPNFDTPAFWQWSRDMTAKGHDVFVSEYVAPNDFVCVWEKSVRSHVSTNRTKQNSKRLEKLFQHESAVNKRKDIK